MRISCPRCTQPVDIPDDAAGQIAKCTACDAKFRVPAAKKTATPSPVRAGASAPASKPEADRRGADRPAAATKSAAERTARPAPARQARVSEDEEEERLRRRRAAEEDGPKKSRRRKKRPQPEQQIPWVLVYLGLMMVLGIALFFAISMRKPPVIASAGGLVGTVGYLLILVLIFRDSPDDGPWCLIFPHQAIGYAWANRATKGPLGIFLIGMTFAISAPILQLCRLDASVPGDGPVAQAPAPPPAPMPAPKPAAPQPAVQQPVDPKPAAKQPAVEQPAPKLENPAAPPKPPAPVVAALTGDPQLDELLAAFDSKKASAASRASIELARMAVKPEHRAVVADKLVQHLNSSEFFVRRAVLHALAKWATSKEVPALVEFGTGNSREAADALAALAPLNDERSIPLAVDGMRQLGSRFQAQKVLRGLGSKCETALQLLLKDSDFFVVQAAVDLLNDVGTGASLPALQQLAASGDAGLQLRAGRAIQSIQRRGRNN
jgi:hypothetical protein